MPFILGSLRWQGERRWIEPFLGSGVVLFNLAPQHALAGDNNPHIIRLYHELACAALTPAAVRDHLEREGRLLSASGGEWYYEVRERFNARPGSLDFLFLNRSCFNGVLRFNAAGGFNVPFGRKPDRFRPAYISKVVNQVAWVAGLLRERDWTFMEGGWHESLAAARPGDFVYADPPYAGRHTSYYNHWDEANAQELFAALQALPCGFALSTWRRNRFRSNPVLEPMPAGVTLRTIPHFYHVGPTEAHRHPMEEALLIRDGFAAPITAIPRPCCRPR